MMSQLVVHELIPAPDPAAICAALDGLPYRIFFDSAETSGKYARYSFVAADPVSVITGRGSSIDVVDGKDGARKAAGSTLVELQNLLRHLPQASVPGLPPFQGGAAGYIGYEFGSALEGVPSPPRVDLQILDLCLGIYDAVFSWDHSSGRAWLVSRSHDRQAFFLGMTANAPAARDQKSGEAHEAPIVTSSLTRDEYRRAITSIREYIAAGDIFQANFAQRFHSRVSVNAWNLYLALREKNPAPFACFFETGDVTIVSASPERFIKVDSSGLAETRPIKGTRPRMPDPSDDEASRMELSASEKDNAEHVMIVDVLRNDLSRVCVTGTVSVTALAEPEAHPTVHHLVSTITGRLRPECDAVDLLLASLPGGSITGAPKIRAMEIIAELEPVRRDVYCGCIAYLTPSGEMDSSIVIRTFLVTENDVYFSAGGGIVADSDPDLEFEETLHKASALFAALETVS
jgi:para-aminobenzoate synthetase component 1